MSEELLLDCHYIGDGAYYKKTPYDLILFTYDGVKITNKVHIDYYYMPAFLEGIGAKKILNKEKYK